MKKFRKILLFILSIFIFLCPISSFAATPQAVEYFQATYEWKDTADGRPLWPGITYNSSLGTQKDLELILLVAAFSNPYKVSNNTHCEFKIKLTTTRYSSMKIKGSFDASDPKSSRDFESATYNDGVITISQNFDTDLEIVAITLLLSDFTYSSNANSNTAFGYSQTTVAYSTQSTNLLNKIGDWFTNLFEKLKGWFDSIFDWLKNIRDNITNGFSNIGTWFTNLGKDIKSWFDNVGDWFSELGDNIKSWFTDLVNKLKTWFENVGKWFTQIGDRISGFFEKLWNRIYYGNENGASEYQKPVINNKLNDVLDILEDYRLQLADAIAMIEISADDVSSYISSGTSFLDGIIGVAGTGFTAMLVFGIVFVLARKVVGR